MYRVTVADQFSEKWVYTVSADSEREALMKLRATSICLQDVVLSIEEVK